MRSFPLPVRVAAGLAVTAAECSRHLPSYLLGLPVTMASQALQVSMRVQQQVTELAIKGDAALTGWRAAEDEPEWATFDEDRFAGQDTTRDEDASDNEDASPNEDASAVPSDYDDLTLARLRGRLRRYSASELVEMLDYERAHARRPEFLRMLANRLDKLRAEETRDI